LLVGRVFLADGDAMALDQSGSTPIR
jgi:hypothetical protein